MSISMEHATRLRVAIADLEWEAVAELLRASPWTLDTYRRVVRVACFPELRFAFWTNRCAISHVVSFFIEVPNGAQQSLGRQLIDLHDPLAFVPLFRLCQVCIKQSWGFFYRGCRCLIGS